MSDCTQWQVFSNLVFTKPEIIVRKIPFFRIIIDENISFIVDKEPIMLITPCIVDIFKLEKDSLSVTYSKILFASCIITERKREVIYLTAVISYRLIRFKSSKIGP